MMNASKRLRKSEHIDGWYIVEGVRGTVPEGTADEWLKTILAIKERRSVTQGRRIGVSVYPDGSVTLFSPRNSTMPEDTINLSPNEVSTWLVAAEELLKTNA
jgi:hypothetical protein